MTSQQLQHAENEYREKRVLGEKIQNYFQEKTRDLALKNFSRIKTYLEAFSPNLHHLIARDIVFAHLDFEPFTSSIAKGEEFTVVSGLNPSSPLHFGHKVLFDLLLFLQKLGATIYIPITNDESYVDGKVTSLAESRRIAYEHIIPSIVAFDFDPKKTKIFVLSDYPDMYNYAMNISKYVTNKYVSTVFGDEALDNSGKAFYRSAVQLSQILLPQLKEFGGVKNTLIPIGIDQHPYILMARDVAKKMNIIPPSEIIFKFQNSLLDPFEKMSGSKPKTAIFLTDTPEEIENKIKKAFTGSVSMLDVHKKLGGTPEACSVFSLLFFHHPDNEFVSDIYAKYKNGKIDMEELKDITINFVKGLILEHQIRTKKVQNVQEFLLNKPLRSFL